MPFIFVALKQKRNYYCFATHFLAFTITSNVVESSSLQRFPVNSPATHSKNKSQRQRRYQVSLRFIFANAKKTLARLHLKTSNGEIRSVLNRFLCQIQPIATLEAISISKYSPAPRLESFPFPNVFLRLDWRYFCLQMSSYAWIGGISVSKCLPALGLVVFPFPNIFLRLDWGHFCFQISSCAWIGGISVSKCLPALGLEVFLFPNVFLRLDWWYFCLQMSSCAWIGVISVSKYRPALGLGLLLFQNDFLRLDALNVEKKECSLN